MWWLANPQDVHRIEDRVSTLYVERCHVDRDDNAVVLVNREQTVRVPAAFIASLLLGPGTRITHGAMRLLADSGTVVCWVGERGVRMYASGLGPSRGSELLMRQAYLVTRTKERLEVARRMYDMRFPDEDVSRATMQQLRGKEGARIKRIYRQESDRTGVPWRKRDYKAGDAFAAGDDINRALSAGHSCLYGICHAAIVGLGASPALGFVHTGSAVSFVLDVADLYKAEYTIPLAFDLVARGVTDERSVRTALRDRVADGGLMSRVVKDIKSLLLAEDGDRIPDDELHLWDEFDSWVPGGTNWASSYAEDVTAIGIAAVGGPDADDAPQVPW